MCESSSFVLVWHSAFVCNSIWFMGDKANVQKPISCDSQESCYRTRFDVLHISAIEPGIIARFVKQQSLKAGRLSSELT